MKKVVAYLTTGYPDPAFCTDLSLELARSGVDAIELGIAFSDPVADGALIEKANHLALERGFKFAHALEVASAIAPSIDTLFMGYFNSFYQQDLQSIVTKASKIKLKGFIIPDLPYEESQAYADLFETHNLANIAFVAPTDTKDRIATLVKDAKEFIYLVAYAGITGSAKSEDLTSIIAHIREASNTPIYVGFGVNRHTARQKAKGVDGVIVGSAFIEILLDDSLNFTQKIAHCKELANIIKSEINA
ncbi:MAG: tryptophan synthase subunit alpha [Sulfuricurvum sp.]